MKVGKGELSRRIFQYEKDDILVNLDFHEGHLIAAKIQPAENFNRKMVVSDRALFGRGIAVKDNVRKMPNGDVFIENVPMIEQGSRGYCAMGTLAMVTRYYGLNLDIDALAAAGGYSEGAPKGGIHEIYQAAAKVGKLKYSREDEWSWRQVKRLIDKGQPVLVWRWFSRPRDRFHTEFTKKLKTDPDAQLPDPKGDDKSSWPTRADGGHASLITGYNEERGEVFFTESWLNNYRNRRMRLEEMAGTVYVHYTFRP